MTAITSLGVGTNGLDLEGLVSKQMAAEQIPLTQIQQRTDSLKTQLSAYGQVQSAVAAMRDAAAKLNSVDTWGASTATSSDAGSVAVSSTTGAALGNVSVGVTRIATAQTLASGVAANATDAFGGGALTIELGSWNADQSGFTAKSGATAVTINIDPGSSLSTIRDKINASGAGVSASIVTDSTGSRLVMRANSTGQSNGFRVTANDGDGNSGDAAGLSALAFDPSSGVNSMTQKVAAGNAIATVNGLDINSETNTLTTAVDGLTISLLKPTTVAGVPNDVSLTVSQDSTSIKTKITAFVTAYNALANLLRTDTKYDDATKTAGTLQGDSAAVGLQNQLRSIIGGTSALGGAFSRLADIGLDPGKDGTISVNDSKLSAGLADAASVKKLFMGLDPSNTSSDSSASDGFAQRLRSFGDQVLGIDGSLTTRQSGLQSQIDSSNKRADDFQAHLDLVEKRLRARYTSLDTQMGQLNSLSTYINQQVTQWSNNG
ncbi:MAG: flagellar filament capping protein FliD [Burkholderiaceae bacterium]